MADEMEGVVTEQEHVNTQADVIQSRLFPIATSLCDPVLLISLAIKSNFSLLERAVTQFDSRFTLRALRSISTLRKHLNADVLSQVVSTTYAVSNPSAGVLLKAIGLEAQQAVDLMNSVEKAPGHKEPIPEIDIYLGILVQVSWPTNYEDLPAFLIVLGILVRFEKL
jgi:hypothetical protein